MSNTTVVNKFNFGQLIKIAGATCWLLHAFGISLGPDLVWLGAGLVALGMAL